MAQRTRMGRKGRHSRPQVRRAPQGSASALRAEAKQGMAASGGLMIGGVQDPAEKAAERTADKVMRMGSPVVHRKQAEGETEDKDVRRAQKEEQRNEPVRAKASPKAAPVAPGATAAPASPGAARAIGSLDAGRPLASAERAFFEPRMNADFSGVRIHEGNAANKASEAINARAFTLGSDIAFAKGEHQPDTDDGRRLMAHELAHIVEGSQPMRRQTAPPPPPPPPPPPQPTRIDLNFSDPIPAGQTISSTLQATADVAGVTWSIIDGTATKAAGTTISNTGVITIDPGQSAGTLQVRASNVTGSATQPFRISSIPTGVSATAFLSALSNATTAYGAAFQDTFISSDGNAASLLGVKVGERFPTAPTPTAATHDFTGAAWPFGARDTFTLHTGTLAADAAGAWVLDSAGEFGPVTAGSARARGDNLSTDKSLINVGNHIQSSSNPSPVGPLPATMTLDQDLHWFNPFVPARSRWTKFATLAHSRTLRSDGSAVEFVTTLNGAEQVESYEGSTGVFGLTASPVNTPKSPTPPATGDPPPPKTVALSVQTLPTALRTGETLTWSFVGAALGCTVAADTSDSKLATLTVGTTAGTVTLEVADMDNRNKARVSVRIT